jgi:hypothetical protein
MHNRRTAQAVNSATNWSVKMENVYTLKGKTSRWQVEVSPSTYYGRFKDLKTGAEGGLWFDEKKELCNYDGPPVVPRAVGAILHALGYTSA